MTYAPAPTPEQIREAASRLSQWLPPTPLVPLGADRAKAEFAQPTGSFKVRGALTAMSRLAERERGTKVVAASAGNHGLAVAFAARTLGLEALVVVPPDCPPVKADRIRRDCPVVVAPRPGYDAAEAHARELAACGGTFLSPFDDTWVMAGNGGSLALELLAQAPDLATVVVPVGGGGLLAGLLAAFARWSPGTRVLAVQSEACPAFARSLANGRCHTSWPPVTTLAEGLEGGAGECAFHLARAMGVQTLTVSEAHIARAMIRLTDELGTPIEGSAAVVDAALRSGALAGVPRPLVGVLTGGNVSMDTIAALRERSPPA